MSRRGRDRHGRGMRGPAVVGPGAGPSARRSRRDRFDDLTLAIITDIDSRWHHRLGLIEYATEDAPILPHDWAADTVPLATLVRGSGTTPSRLVLFRRPMEQRCETREELRALVLVVVVEQIAELIGVAPSEIDRRYPQ